MVLYFVDDIPCIFHARNRDPFERLLAQLQERFQLRRTYRLEGRKAKGP